jgi:uncharacterized protein (TIGR02118 family)
MAKIIHLYKRRSGSNVEEFHRALAEISEDDPQIPNLCGYTQSHTLVQGYRKGELLFDALEEFSFPSIELARQFFDSGLPDELYARREALVDDDATLTMKVDVYRVKNQPVPRGSVKNIEFVNRRPSMDLAAFRQYWREVHGPLGATIHPVLRYEQNHLWLECYKAGIEPRFDGLAITWFESTQAMRDGAKTTEYEATRADEINFLSGHLPIIVTREVRER